MSKKKPDVEMTPEQQAAAEAEKAQLLAQLAERGARGSVRVFIPAATPVAPAPKAKTVQPEHPAPQVPPTPPARSTADIKAELAALEAQLAEAQKQEIAYKQHQAAVDQRTAAQCAAEELAPLSGRLELALREIDRVQRTYGYTLREYGRLCASGTVDERRALSEIYSAAPPLGQKLGEDRRTIETAIGGIKCASESGRVHEVEQAKVLADAALAINILALEIDCKTLIEAKEALRGGTAVTVTPGHQPPMRGAGDGLTAVDFGRSII
jgi:hypothetical protein